MKTLREVEPFAYGYMNADCDDVECRIANGLREYARFVPLEIDGNGLYVTIKDRSNPSFGAVYACNTGISASKVRFEKSMEENPGIADEIRSAMDYMLPLDTSAALEAVIPDDWRKLKGDIPCENGKKVRVCWGGTWIGHGNPDYHMLLHMGTAGLRTRVDLGRKVNPGKEAFYESLSMSLDALDILGERARKLAYSLGKKEIAEAFENVPKNEPHNFREACLMFWLVFIFDGVDSPGRFDYTMDDYCTRCTEKERTEYMEGLWQLFKGIRAWNLCIGGSDEKGGYFSNVITEDVLRIARKYKYNTPNITMRISSATPDKLLAEAAKTIATGIGMPALYNDECVCPALEDLGITPVDAHNYCMNGCNQIDIFGKSHMGLEDGELSLAKCLEFVLHNGKCALSNEKFGIDVGDTTDFETFDELFAAYKREVEYMTDIVVEMSNYAQKFYAEYAPNPLRSNLICGCVEKGLDYKNGGPIYGHGQILAEGIADTADSLAALREYVYKRKKYTLSEVVAALDCDFEGYDEMLFDFKSFPKFGNDVPEVDELCAMVVGHFYSYLGTKRTFRGGIYGGGCSTFNRAAIYGGSVGALPSGKRRNSDLFADSVGAVPGNDKKGPTALLNSVVRQPQRLAKSGHVLNLKFTKTLFATDAGENAFAKLVRTYFQNGGQQLSVSVVSGQELREAQKHPEKYGNLIVRVGGYSDYFNNLSKGLQDNIIARTEIEL